VRRAASRMKFRTKVFIKDMVTVVITLTALFVNYQIVPQIFPYFNSLSAIPIAMFMLLVEIFSIIVIREIIRDLKYRWFNR